MSGPTTYYPLITTTTQCPPSYTINNIDNNKVNVCNILFIVWYGAGLALAATGTHRIV